MGNVVDCCCYRTNDEDLEPADQRLLKLAASSKGGGGPGACEKGGDEKGSHAARLSQIAAIARSNRRRLSKGAPPERGSLLVEPQHISTSQCGAVATDGAACIMATGIGSSRAWAVAARSSEPGGSAASWAQLEAVLGDLDAAMSVLTGPEARAGLRNITDEDSARVFSPASSSNLSGDTQQKTASWESGLSEVEALEANGSDDDDDDAAEPGESLYATTEDAQSTLQEFSGAEETLPLSDGPSPRVNSVAAAAAAWAAERGLSLEGGGLEEMYKYF